MRVTIEIEFEGEIDGENLRESVYEYLLELIEDGSLEYEVTEI